MADLTTKRRPVDETAKKLDLRRQELALSQLRTDNMRDEVGILEHEDHIERLKKNIESRNINISELEAKLSAKDEEPASEKEEVKEIG